jgi:hypothetical protein
MKYLDARRNSRNFDTTFSYDKRNRVYEIAYLSSEGAFKNLVYFHNETSKEASICIND